MRAVHVRKCAGHGGVDVLDSRLRAALLSGFRSEIRAEIECLKAVCESVPERDRVEFFGLDNQKFRVLRDDFTQDRRAVHRIGPRLHVIHPLLLGWPRLADFALEIARVVVERDSTASDERMKLAVARKRHELGEEQSRLLAKHDAREA